MTKHALNTQGQGLDRLFINSDINLVHVTQNLGTSSVHNGAQAMLLIMVKTRRPE